MCFELLHSCVSTLGPRFRCSKQKFHRISGLSATRCKRTSAGKRVICHTVMHAINKHGKLQLHVEPSIKHTSTAHCRLHSAALLSEKRSVCFLGTEL